MPVWWLLPEADQLPCRERWHITWGIMLSYFGSLWPPLGTLSGNFPIGILFPVAVLFFPLIQPVDSSQSSGSLKLSVLWVWLSGPPSSFLGCVFYCKRPWRTGWSWRVVKKYKHLILLRVGKISKFDLKRILTLSPSSPPFHHISRRLFCQWMRSPPDKDSLLLVNNKCVTTVSSFSYLNSHPMFVLLDLSGRRDFGKDPWCSVGHPKDYTFGKEYSRSRWTLLAPKFNFTSFPYLHLVLK